MSKQHLGRVRFRDLKINDEFIFVNQQARRPIRYRVVGFTRSGYTVYERLDRCNVQIYTACRHRDSHIFLEYRCSGR